MEVSVVQWKDICLWQPEFGPEEMHLFLEIKEYSVAQIGCSVAQIGCNIAQLNAA